MTNITKNQIKNINLKDINYYFEPRLYTTNLSVVELISPNLKQCEYKHILKSLRADFNKKNFITKKTTKHVTPLFSQKILNSFVLFLLDSCTAEFSGFLLYKELSQNIGSKNKDVAEGFSLLSRDEARHSGFLKKNLQNFFLNIDLCFITKMRGYTFLLPKFIYLTAYLSEKIGYWRYIAFFRHFEKTKNNRKLYLFKYFEAWCQDERKHGDFLYYILEKQNLFKYSYETDFWYNFFLFSVLISMLLNDLKKQIFFENNGINYKKFGKFVIKNLDLNLQTSIHCKRKFSDKKLLELCFESLFLVENFSWKYFYSYLKYLFKTFILNSTLKN